MARKKKAGAQVASPDIWPQFIDERPVLLPHPKAICIPGIKEDKYRCPVCGFEEVIDAFDVLGADEGCLFCNGCTTELRFS